MQSQFCSARLAYLVCAGGLVLGCGFNDPGLSISGDASVDATLREDSASELPSDTRDSHSPPDYGYRFDTAPPSPGHIECGDSTCTVGSEKCCVGKSDGGFSQKCSPASLACEGVAKACDSREDCPKGQICCFKGGKEPLILCSADKLCAGDPQAPTGGWPLCRSESDCPDGRRHCCPAPVGGIIVSVCSAQRC